MLQTYVIKTYSQIAPLLSDCQLTHSLIMQGLPNDLENTRPRAAAECLWRVQDEGASVIVQTNRPFNTDVLGTDPETSEPMFPVQGAHIQLTVRLAALKTPPSDVPQEIRATLKAHGKAYRSRQVIVQKQERHSWALKRLQRIGFEADPTKLEMSPLEYADLGRRGGGIPFVQIEAVGHVQSAGIFHSAQRQGIGRGRNFGLGLITVTAA